MVTKWSFRTKMAVVGVLTGIPVTTFTLIALVSNSRIRLAAQDEMLAAGAGAEAAKIAMEMIGRSTSMILMSYLLGLVITIPLTAIVIRRVIRIVGDITECMTGLAGGKVEVDIPHAHRDDELGHMARSIQVFKDQAAELCKIRTVKAQQRQDFVVKRDMLALTDALDGEAQFTVGRVATDAGEVVRMAGVMGTSIDDVRTHSASVEADAEMTTANVEAVAAATEELASSSKEIGRQVNSATQIAGQAVIKAEHASQTIKGMVTASQEIRHVLTLINDIASQTNLLALNATIEAARAGDAGKGFAVVAGEVKVLANQTARATDEIAERINGIVDVSRQALAAIDDVGVIIGQINEIAMVIAAAVEEQGAATYDISHNAHDAASRTRQVSESIVAIADAAGHSLNLSGNVTDLADGAAHRLQDLQDRLKLILRQTTAMNSSRNGALPVEMPATLVAGSSRTPCLLHDLTIESATVREGPTLTRGERVDIEVPEVGRIPATVEFIDPLGADIKLIPAADVQQRLGKVLSGYLALDVPLIAVVRENARRIGSVFEAAIDRGEISLDDLFDEDYQPVAGTNPQQVLTRFTTFTDRVLPPIQEALLSVHPGVAFAAAVDRNGYLPTHNLKFSKPQSADAVWNAANCRNRRIFNDRTGLRAGRNTEPHLLQSYLRDMGGGNYVMMQDLSAPIEVKGRHWGGLRMGYSLAK